ncbi:helicase-related protein [Desulfonatronovibrio magnus]|uniref:helicase-related protein n=1 Tax=Desulfonatronovibrio magnus TaxID=698827 RepID=UPI0005EB6C81|nr:helicase-related protein [Desulfonatronovibrio magnus]
MPHTLDKILAPGARILVRDAEWLVRRVDRSSTGGQALTCIGLSELVRDKEAVFLTAIEALKAKVQVLDPSTTSLVPDNSSHYLDSRLYLESLLRQTPPTDVNLYIGHKAAMDMVPFQLDPALQALDKPRQRILIADAVGLGKTLEAGILLSELIRRGRGKRILVVTMKSMLTQFQKELWTRFTIPLTRLDSIGLQRVRSRIPANHNPFYYFDRSIISIDTLKQDNEFRVHLEKAAWDVIVIDEAHNVAERGHGRTQRSRLARLLSKQSDSLIMLSATPHDGRARSFASLMNMLDPTAIANPDDYGPQDIQGLFIRRFKKDIQHQVQGSFKERKISTSHVDATPAEETAFETLMDMNIQNLDKGRGSGHLFRTILEKALFSSPAACMETIDSRLNQLAKASNSSLSADIEALTRLRRDVAAIGPEDFSRFTRLIKLMTDPQSELFWTGQDPSDRLVIFTERIATLNFLTAHLPGRLNLKTKHVAALHGGLSDIDQQKIVEDFGRDESHLRLLIASDVASEGINLHYLCHRLIHFDIPWSLMVFQQRNGRIDRYGQEKTPLIHYLVTTSVTPKIHGDMRILDLLIHKDDEAVKNIGYPSALMGVYDIDEEEARTARALEENLSPEAFETQLLSADQEDTLDLLAFLEQGQQSSSSDSGKDRLGELPTLFADDFDFALKGLSRLFRKSDLNFDIDEDKRILEMEPPQDLIHRFRFLPREIQPRNGRLIFTDSKDLIQDEIKRCRKDELAWPALHFLWPLHPAMQWLNDRVQTFFGRHEAPVLTLPTLNNAEIIFLLTGIIPNRKGQPLIQKWFGISMANVSFKGILSLKEVLQRTELDKRSFANPGDFGVRQEAADYLPQVIHKAREWMKNVRREFEDHINVQLNQQLSRLEELRERHILEIDHHLGSKNISESIRQKRRQERLREVNSLFENYIDWIEDTMSTEDHAYIKVGAVLQGLRD